MAAWKELAQELKNNPHKIGVTLLDLENVLIEFEKEFWDGPKTPDERIRHITLHIGTLVGKVTRLEERRDHNLSNSELAEHYRVLDEEVTPDLLYYALALAWVRGLNLQKSFLDRLGANEKRVTDFVTKRDQATD